MTPRVALLCGSLRSQSSNHEMLRAFAEVLGSRAVVVDVSGLGRLPHFNPDLDTDSVPDEVVAFRSAVCAADAIVISTPEYAHGLPGSFKNGLDWLVSHPPFAGKKVSILYSDRGSTWALDSLREILRTMSADIMEEGVVGLRLDTNKMTAEAILARDDFRLRLAHAGEAILAACKDGA